MLTQMEISLLIRLIIAHLLTDFVLQSDSWVKRKAEGGWHSKYLYAHGAIAGILAYLFSGFWSLFWVPVVIAVTHTVIDGLKAGHADNIKAFALDQFGHIAVLLAVWLWIIAPGPEDLAVLEQLFLSGTRIWVIIAAYVTVIWPASVLISKFTEKWRKNDSEDESLENAGKWIGRLERVLILTFVLLQKYEAIGLLVAAKSIFRFSESRHEGEYVLIGTLISFTVAIIVGLIANMFL
jgi:hypothetical protein